MHRREQELENPPPEKSMSEAKSPLEHQLARLIVDTLNLEIGPEEIVPDAPLFREGLGLDSIDALELAVSLEKTFGVGVPNSEVAAKALRNVNTIHDYVLEKRGERAA